MAAAAAATCSESVCIHLPLLLPAPCVVVDGSALHPRRVTLTSQPLLIPQQSVSVTPLNTATMHRGHTNTLQSKQPAAAAHLDWNWFLPITSAGRCELQTVVSFFTRPIAIYCLPRSLHSLLLRRCLPRLIKESSAPSRLTSKDEQQL